MSSLLKLRRGSTIAHETFTGADGEVTFNTDTNALVTHDGSTVGGFSHVKAADLSAFSGSSLVGFIQSGTGAVAQTVQGKLRESISVLGFFANGVSGVPVDPTGVIDSSLGIQTAINYVNSNGGGTVFVPAGTYLCNTPLRLMSGVNLIGAGRESTTIKKDSTTTKAVTIVAGALVIYNNALLPSNLNACLILDGLNGRYVGNISDLTLEGALATPSNYETQKVEFGIVSVGSVSDYVRERVDFVSFQYSEIYPVLFVAALRDSRTSTCLHGAAIDNGTSIQYTTNYANDCRDWGHFIRGVLYSTISGNAVDNLNAPSKYPTRTRTCNAYYLRSLVGCSITSNGDEQTWGRSYFLETLDNCTVENNTSVGIGSDYVGTDQIAWIYSDGILRCSKVVNNIGYTVKTGGLLYGGAVAGQHHNIYFLNTNYVINSEFTGNMVRIGTSGSPVEAGWGNNIPTTWVNPAVGGDLLTTFSPTITANTVGNLVVTYNAGNKHYQHAVGSLCHVFGCFNVTLTYTTAGSYLIFAGFPQNQAIRWKIAITGVDGGSTLTKKLASFALNANGYDGIAYDENDDLVYITDIPTGTTLQIFYDGWYAKA